MYKQNLHTHTVFCDGKNTVEEMVQKAIELGFDSLGFSGHIYKNYAESSMAKKDIPAYQAEVRRAQEKYQEQIAIYLGAEYDMFADHDKSAYDYTIGSVHCLIKDGNIYEMDQDAATVKKIIEENFSGDGLAFAKAYYQIMATMPSYGKFDVVGHFDLVNKHCEKQGFFDDACKAYQDAALQALYAVAEKQSLFEVNVGGIARGYKSIPYPAPFLMKQLKALGCRLILSSDCHDKNFLDANFDLGIEYIKSFGFDELFFFDGKGFVGQKI